MDRYEWEKHIKGLSDFNVNEDILSKYENEIMLVKQQNEINSAIVKQNYINEKLININNELDEIKQQDEKYVDMKRVVELFNMSKKCLEDGELQIKYISGLYKIREEIIEKLIKHIKRGE